MDMQLSSHDVVSSFHQAITSKQRLTLGFASGLKFVRKFALQIAQENHDAVLAMDQAEEEQRVRKERAADAAAATAFAKVEHSLKAINPKARVPVPATTTTSKTATPPPSTAAKPQPAEVSKSSNAKTVLQVGGGISSPSSGSELKEEVV